MANGGPLFANIIFFLNWTAGDCISLSRVVLAANVLLP